MTQVVRSKPQTILFGVTASQSLKLLGDIPTTMARHGWEVHVVADNASSSEQLGLNAVQLHSVPMVRRPSPIRDAIALLRWLVLVARVKPSVVAVGTPKAALLGLLSSFVCRVPARIYVLRGLRLETVAGLGKRILVFLEWVASRSSTHILAVSPSLKEEYSRQGLSSEEKIQVLGHGSSHGVDVSHFNPKRWLDWSPPEARLGEAISSNVPILGFVGRLSPEKGSRELLACHKALLLSGFQHKLLVVGPIEERAVSDELRTSTYPGIICTGAVSDTAPYYSVMDILLLPTHREGFPNVILEAAASGVPAITTDATGASDSVVHEETGLIIRVGDTFGLSSGVKRLLADSQLRSTMGTNARSRVVQYFDSNNVVEQYRSFFTRVSASFATEREDKNRTAEN